jgi:hypothetical protein
MKKTRSKKSRDTVPLNELSIDQLGNIMVVWGEGVTQPKPDSNFRMKTDYCKGRKGWASF